MPFNRKIRTNHLFLEAFLNDVHERGMDLQVQKIGVGQTDFPVGVSDTTLAMSGFQN